MNDLLPTHEQMVVGEHKHLTHAWIGSDISKMLLSQQDLLASHGHRANPTVLVSDFDNSFFSEDTKDQSVRLSTILEHYSIPLIIATGNDAQALIAKVNTINAEPGSKILQPHVIIGAVGTDIWVRHTDASGTITYQKDTDFSQYIKDKPFNRQKLAEQAAKAMDKKALRDWRITFQKPKHELANLRQTATPEQQRVIEPYKLSFYGFATDSTLAQMTETITSTIAGNHTISVCEEVGYNRDHAEEIAAGAAKKYCIDFLPVKPKTEAVHYALKVLGIKRSMTVGDSGNDISMTRDAQTNVSVITGGAKPELVRQTLTDIADPPSGTFIKRKNPHKRIFIAVAPVAGGTLEVAKAYLQRLKTIDSSPLIDQLLLELSG